LRRQIDLNCDLGESFGPYVMGADAEVMPLITSANVACGFHAGDPSVMRRTVRLAKQHGVSVGAHPGFRDLVGFGRRELKCSPDEIYADVLYQIGALAAVCRAEGVRLHHVKPHGALYNMACAHREMARAVTAAVADFDRSLVLFALPGSELHRAGLEAGLRVACEAFADRRYNEDGSLVPRGLPGAVLEDEAEAEAQVCRMVLSGKADTICVHGDNPRAIAFIRRIRQRLLAEGVALAAPFAP
jgi:UPF0271 protein